MMKNLFLLLSGSFLLMSCASQPQAVTAESKPSPRRSIASVGEAAPAQTIELSGWYAGEGSSADIESYADFIKDEYGADNIEFRINGRTAEGQPTFIFKITRPNAEIIHRHMIAKIQSRLADRQDPLQENERRALLCTKENVTFSNFMVDLSASEEFKLKFSNVTAPVKEANLQSGRIESKPRCESWGSTAELAFEPPTASSN